MSTPGPPRRAGRRGPAAARRPEGRGCELVGCRAATDFAVMPCRACGLVGCVALRCAEREGGPDAVGRLGIEQLELELFPEGEDW